MLERIRRFMHDYLGWAYPLRGTEHFPYMEISEHAICRFCGGKLLRSSQGWFHADDVKVELRGDAE